ncbi:tRNA-dihydrouridine(16/17) synthase [NAD(P)(+)]-like [Holothuria leucospilota]|uniref:tRNA-dihydrouridine(16/17) synthase [NAD(P)(+)] n=1 Tax=Holothuria leucospilota TaxID=206669 RepID=A0A9Q1H9Q3_HOLLE|nr:tRNA-dihydrouridine(16/17) synthase [NAD(P)(+)]-like [Holothuria leucospilota]
MAKKEGYDFWREDLGKPKYVLAPMVAQSELPWRLLSRRHGAQLCYTPMFHSQLFVKDSRYRKSAITTCPEDKPLFFQFCANTPESFLGAAKLVEDICQGVDLNLGCPQGIAKRGHYGAFLQDEWDLIFKIINHAHKNLSIPVTCKIRVLESKERTVEYAKMLERAGAQIITVHGRTREMKGILTGLADWDLIKAVKQAVKVPVFANGNIQSLGDVQRCLEETGVDGVMSAEGNLYNPYIFEGKYPPVWEVATEYLQLVKEYPCSLSSVRGHLFKLWIHALEKHQHLRSSLGKAHSLEDMSAVCQEMKKCCEMDSSDEDTEKHKNGNLHPYWLCQPYFRPSAEETLKKGEETVKKRKLEELGEEENYHLEAKNQTGSEKVMYRLCQSPCRSPCSLRCVFKLCKQCCKVKAKSIPADCPGHKLMFKSRLEKKKRESEDKLKTDSNRTETVEEDSKTLSVSTPMNGNIMTTDGRDCKDDSGSSLNNCSHSPLESENEVLIESVCDQEKTNSSIDVPGNFKEQTEKDEMVSGTSGEVQEGDSVIGRTMTS